MAILRKYCRLLYIHVLLYTSVGRVVPCRAHTQSIAFIYIFIYTFFYPCALRLSFCVDFSWYIYRISVCTCPCLHIHFLRAANSFFDLGYLLFSSLFIVFFFCALRKKDKVHICVCVCDFQSMACRSNNMSCRCYVCTRDAHFFLSCALLQLFVCEISKKKKPRDREKRVFGATLLLSRFFRARGLLT